MLSSMNTIAFAEEVAVDEADAVLETADVVAEDAAVAEADDEAVLDNAYQYDKDDKLTTTVDYAEGTTKGKKDIATITHTSDPVSWNGFDRNGRRLLATVLFGANDEDKYLNNSNPLTVSNNGDGSNDPLGVQYNGEEVFDVISIKDGYYLLVGYRGYDPDDDGDGDKWHVEGADDQIIDTTYGADGYNPGFAWIPVFEWDGRTIEFNKSRNHKFDAKKKEALDVAVSLVKYEGDTVKEISGVEVGNVKVDKKAMKTASVSASSVEVTKPRKYWDSVKKAEDTDEKYTIWEYKLVNGFTVDKLPSFTVTAKIKSKDSAVKGMKKDIANALKDKSYQFAIKQSKVSVYEGNIGQAIVDLGLNNAKGDAISASSNKIGEEIAGWTWSIMDGVDDTWLDLGGLRLTKFNGKKATIVKRNGIGDDESGRNETADITLKEKTDYTLKPSKLAGEDVTVLELPEEGGEGSFVYSKDKFNAANIYSNLAGFGYKWAFRVSPNNKKTYRTGAWMNETSGFVFSPED